MAVSTGVNEMLLEEVFGVYTAAEEVMLEKLAKNVSKGINGGWAKDKTGDVQAVQKELEAALAAIHEKTLPGTAKAIVSAYLKGTNSANVDLKLPKTSLKRLDIPYHIQRLILDANEIVKGASLQILRGTMDAYRAIVADSTAVMLTGVETRLDAAQRALDAFALKGITGFVDRAGRKWEMASYVEMAIRTASARAALQGHIDRSTELGHDLMIVSHFGKTCPVCAPWEGKPLSISGKTPGYPSLAQARAAGLFHPNCKHTLMAYFPGITEVPMKLDNDDEAYQATQVQRHNERQIRKWKRVEAVAMTPEAKQRARAKVSAWQAAQRKHVERYGLRRKYYRESIKNRIGNAANAKLGTQALKLDDVSWKKQQQAAMNAAMTPKPKAKPNAVAGGKGIKPKAQKEPPKRSVVPKAVEDLSSYEYIPIGHKDVLRDADTISKMPSSRRRAIYRYTGNAYEDMNKFLRKGYTQADDPDIYDLCNDLKETLGIYANGLSQNTVVMRHMDMDAIPAIFDSETHHLMNSAFSGDRTQALNDMKKKLVGGTFEDKGFLSTSYQKGIFVRYNGVQVRMYLPKGYDNGMFVESISQFNNEREYLINAGQKFKIVDVSVEDVGRAENVVIHVIPK